MIIVIKYRFRIMTFFKISPLKRIIKRGFGPKKHTQH